MVLVKHANKRACPSQIVPSIGVDMEANICHRHHHVDDIPSLTCHPQHHHLKETFLLIEALERNIAFITSTKQCMWMIAMIVKIIIRIIAFDKRGRASVGADWFLFAPFSRHQTLSSPSNLLKINFQNYLYKTGNSLQLLTCLSSVWNVSFTRSIRIFCRQADRLYLDT